MSSQEHAERIRDAIDESYLAYGIDGIPFRRAARDSLAALVSVADKAEALAEAARLVQAMDDAGGDDWWEAHAKLYAALAAFGSGEGDTT